MNIKVLSYSLTILACFVLLAINFQPHQTNYASAVSASLGLNVDQDDVNSDMEENVDKPTLTRGPYTQMATPKNVIVKWRTSRKVPGVLRYGLDPKNLDHRVNVPAPTTGHAVRVDGLTPDTKYYYAIGATTETLAGGKKKTDACLGLG